jgi:hypothetical protein
VVVVGPHLAGLSTTKQRVLAELAQRKVVLSEDQAVDLSIGASAQEVGQALSKVRAKDLCVLFVHDFWKEVAEAKSAPDWIASDQFVLDELGRCFHEFHVIYHLVKSEDAKRIVESYWNSRGIPPKEVRSSLSKSIISLSKAGDTYIPKIIYEELEAWCESNPAVVEKLEHGPHLREDEEAISSAFDQWEKELEEYLSGYDKLLAILGLGGTGSSLLATSLGVEQAVLNLLGISAASTVFVFGLPVTLAFFVAAALGFVASTKRDLPQTQRKEFEKYTTRFLAAQEYWDKLTPAQKEVICYELDKKTHRQLGTALHALVRHFDKGTDPERPGENLIKQVENDLGIKLEAILTEKILREVNKLLEKEREEILRRVESLEVTVSHLRSEWTDPAKQRIAWTYIENPQTLQNETLMRISNLQSFSPRTEGGLSEFVPFENGEKLYEQLSSRGNLFVTGLSGTGKSRIIFEALQRRKKRAYGIWVIGAVKGFAEGPQGTVGDLCGKIEIKAKKVGSPQILVWDNFPDLLENNLDLDVCRGVLTRIACLPTEECETIIALDPANYESMKEIAKRFPPLPFEFVDIHYNLRDLSKLVESLGMLLLGENEYNARIAGRVDDIAGILYKNFNLPLAVKDYCEKLKTSKQSDPIETATAVGTVSFSKYIERQYMQLEQQDAERKDHVSNMDLLYTMKLLDILNKDTSMSEADKQQRRIFKTESFNPLKQLHAYIEADAGAYVMHRFYLRTLDIPDDKAKLIFSYIKEENLDDILEFPEHYPSSEFTAFLCSHCSCMKPEEFARILLVASQVNIPLGGRGIGTNVADNFHGLPDNYKDTVVKLVSENTEFAHGFGEGTGRRFDKLSDGWKDRFVRLAFESNNFAEGFGHGTGGCFDELCQASRNRLLKLTSENKEFASRFGGGVPFEQLSEASKDMLVKLACENEDFAGGFGYGAARRLDDLSDGWRDRLVKLASQNKNFADGFGFNSARRFDELSDLWKDRLVRLASENDDFAGGFGRGGPFASLSEAWKDRLVSLAFDNKNFASCLGYSAGFLFDESFDRWKDRFLKLVSENTEFAHAFGEGAGACFDRLSEASKDRLVRLASENKNFAEGFGDATGLGFGLDELSEMSKNRLLKLASENKEFARGFGQGTGSVFEHLPEGWKDKLARLASENNDFAGTFGYGAGVCFCFDGLPDAWKDKLVKLASGNEEFAGGFGEGVGRCFDVLTEASRDSLVKFASGNDDFAKGLGKGASGCFNELPNAWKGRLVRLASENKNFAQEFKMKS